VLADPPPVPVGALAFPSEPFAAPPDPPVLVPAPPSSAVDPPALFSPFTPGVRSSPCAQAKADSRQKTAEILALLAPVIAPLDVRYTVPDRGICPASRPDGLQTVYARRTMLRLRYPLFVVLAMFVACGGKVLVDQNGGGDQGAGGSGVASTSAGTSGSYGTAGAYVAGFYDTGGAYTAGFYGAGGLYAGGDGGAYVAGFAGFYTGGGGGPIPCGPVLCPLGSQCCSPSCGICTPFGAACPAVVCGGGTAGFAGSFGTGGAPGCGTFPSCQARIPGPLACPPEAQCLCGSCMCQSNACENDPGCQQIWSCALKFNCHGKQCYSPQSCQPIMDKVGTGSPSMSMYLNLESCRTGSGCATYCGVVDAGPACASPPPAVGGGACVASGGAPSNECSWACTDLQMNSYISKCSGPTCNCYYNGRLTCTCPGKFNQGSACGECCPSSPGWTR
jgi:hypothetical protein